MMSELQMERNSANRRDVLKQVGVAGSTLLTGVSGLAGTVSAESTDPAIDFDPYDVKEVGEFVNKFVVKGRKEKSGAKPDEVRFRERIPQLQHLSDEQREAVLDGIKPYVLRTETSGPTQSSADSTQPQRSETMEVMTDSAGKTPFEKWNWDKPDHLTERLSSASTENDTVNASDSNETFSNVQEQLAISIDYTAWRWKCVISWSYTNSEITDSSSYDTILYTNYNIEHKGTDKEKVGVADDEYEVNFQATFDNSIGQICDPITGSCINLKSTYHPAQQLKGDTNGDGTVVLNSKDTLAG